MLSQTEVSESSSCNPAPLSKALRGLHLALLASACVVTNVLPATAQSQPKSQQIDQPASTDGQLEDIVITASEDDPVGWQGAPEWVYETPRAVSVIGRDEIKNSNTRTAADLFESMPGVAVADNPQDPGISINIRGLQDQNRINVMIDGARQNFQKSGHVDTSRFYIDPAFIKQIEVEKSALSGVGGAGALGGTVNFRSLEASDIIRNDRMLGFEGKLSSGTNAYDFNGNLAAGLKLNDNISIVGGISKKQLGEYEAGENGSLKLSGNGQPLVFSGSEASSWLAKVNIAPDEDHSLALSALGFQDKLSKSTPFGTFPSHSDVSNYTGTGTYTWQPDNLLFDLEAKVWANKTHNSQYIPERPSGTGAFEADFAMTSLGGSLQNTSDFDFSKFSLSWNYGVEAFKDFGDTSSKSVTGADDPFNVWFGSDPEGQRGVFSAFNQFTLNYNDFVELNGGLRYDHFTLSGSSRVATELDPGTFTLSGFADEAIKSSGSRVSPTISLSVAPVENLQVFGKYSEGFRVPTIMETMLGGQHFGTGVPLPFFPNADLKPELARTWEGGLNLHINELVQSNDRLNIKLSAFTRELENYTAQGFVSRPLDIAGIPGASYPWNGVAYVNLLDNVRSQGIELDAAYDAGQYFAGISFSKTFLDLDRARYKNKAASVPDTLDDALFSLTAPPETQLSFRLGLRFFEEKLKLGGQYTHIVPGKARGSIRNDYVMQQYSVVDLFGSYQFHEHAELRVDIDNLTDTAYIDALTGGEYPAAGRTMTASLNFNF